MNSFKQPVVLSYVLFAGLLVMVGMLHLTVPLLTILFTYFLLGKLDVGRSKIVPVSILMIILALLSWLSIHFLKQAFVGLPALVSKSLPAMAEYLASLGVALPFDDLQSLRGVMAETLSHEWESVGKFAGVAVKDLALMVIGIVVGVSMYINPEVDLDRYRHPVANNYYSKVLEGLGLRFRSFYTSFETVMGAQVLISLINTGMTSVFITIAHLPFSAMLIGVTFLCGLFPIIGNLISNTVIVGIAFTVSPKMAISALVFLVVLHKLEYFLNSKIIGDRIKNPVWMTLLGLVLGERLMGIPGMILAPVVLNFIKVEASSANVESEANEEPVTRSEIL